jgi:hypothetical protein
MIKVSRTGYKKMLRVRDFVWSGPLALKHYGDKHKGHQEYQH